MSPDLRIRGVDDQTHARLVARANANGRSIEGELRVLLADALVDGSGIGPADWEHAGFDEPDEIVAGRIYEVVAAGRHFRISITRAIDERSTKWTSNVDELVEILADVDGHRDRLRVWTNPLGIADRHLGDTAEMALRDVMHWLSDYTGVDPVSRARRSADEEAKHHPGLHLLVGDLRDHLGSDAVISWQDHDVARVSMGHLNFVVSRLVDKIVIKHGVGSSAAAGDHQFLMSEDVANHIASHMRLLVQAESDRSKARSKARKASPLIAE